MNKIKVSRQAPKDIQTSWDSQYIVEPLTGQSQQEAEELWTKIKRDCREFPWVTLIKEGSSEVFSG